MVRSRVLALLVVGWVAGPGECQARGGSSNCLPFNCWWPSPVGWVGVWRWLPSLVEVVVELGSSGCGWPWYLLGGRASTV